MSPVISLSGTSGQGVLERREADPFLFQADGGAEGAVD
jgi:hypothetical protein